MGVGACPKHSSSTAPSIILPAPAFVFYHPFCAVYCSLRVDRYPYLYLLRDCHALIVVASRREMPRLLSAVRIIRRSRPRLLYYHLSLYFSFLHRLYSNPLTTPAVSK